jgi:hypothetical protein
MVCLTTPPVTQRVYIDIVERLDNSEQQIVKDVEIGGSSVFGVSEENHEKPRSRQPVFKPKFEPETRRIQDENSRSENKQFHLTVSSE